MIIAIERNDAIVALARTEDVVACTNDAEANALRAAGYEPLRPGATSRPATPEEQEAFTHWQAGRAC